MTYQNILDQVKRIGHLTDTEFNQADYRDACWSLINNAILDLATTNGKQYAQYTIDENDAAAHSEGEMVEYSLNGVIDFISFADDNIVYCDGRYLASDAFLITSDKSIMLPYTTNAKYVITYVRKPRLLKSDSIISTVIDLPEQYAALIPYFVAATLYLDDNQVIANTCYNKYGQMKAQLYSSSRSDTTWHKFYNYEHR